MLFIYPQLFAKPLTQPVSTLELGTGPCPAEPICTHLSQDAAMIQPSVSKVQDCTFDVGDLNSCTVRM